MEEDHKVYPRHASSAVEAALQDTRVVIINGARQTGKSTVAKWAAETRPSAATRLLDIDAMRSTAVADPDRFVRHDGLLVIDEIQRAPELMLAIKHQVDIDPRPGRFLLTGSAQLFALNSVPDLLTGRTETIELWPLAQGEIDGTRDSFVESIFEFRSEMSPESSPLIRDDYIARALRGGYPEAVRRADLGRRARFFEAYVSDLVRRDVHQISEIDRPAEMRRLLNVVAAQMATLATPHALAKTLGLSSSTLTRYLNLLERVFVIRRIPAWSNNLTTRAIATPKMIVIDSGVGGHLASMTLKRAQHPTALVGPLLENFVLSELARQLSWAPEPIQLYHYRDRDGYEVDAVLERGSGDIVAIEVKAAETVRAEDFRGIRHLQSRLGDRLIAGIVLYAGHHALSFGDRLHAWPISSLWTM